MSLTLEESDRRERIDREIVAYVLKNIEYDDIEEVENNCGSLYITLKNGENYFVMVEKCEEL